MARKPLQERAGMGQAVGGIDTGKQHRLDPVARGIRTLQSLGHHFGAAGVKRGMIMGDGQDPHAAPRASTLSSEA